MKVLCITDKVGTALHRLGTGVEKYHDNLDYKVLDVHPKRPSMEQIQALRDELPMTDLIDAQYFKSMEMLRELMPEIKQIPTILTHNNPYSIEESNWNSYSANVGNNMYIYNRLNEITETHVEYIPLTVDTDKWTYNADWQPNKNVIMVAHRIEGKKGILPVAIACNELGLKFILVGSISDPQYFRNVMDSGDVEFHEHIPDEELLKLYHNSTIHVCNSVNNFESGTLPVLESMLAGVPVLSRKVGHIPDLYNGENMMIHDGDSEDVQMIADHLSTMMADKKLLQTQREKAWQTAKGRSHFRRAYMYQRLYRQVLFPEQKSVSVVVPIFDKPEIIRKCLDAIDNQTHKNIEIVVVDDNPSPNKELVEDFKKYTSKPVRYIHSGKEDYGLARARNLGTIAATGDVMVYCDQRMIMQPDAIEQFLLKLKPKYFLYGNKGAKKEFVENFSCIDRSDIITAGMFNERIDCYGGMSQEIRNRVRGQGIQTEYVEAAKATPTGKSSNRNRKRDEIIRAKNILWQMGLEQ